MLQKPCELVWEFTLERTGNMKTVMIFMHN